MTHLTKYSCTKISENNQKLQLLRLAGSEHHEEKIKNTDSNTSWMYLLNVTSHTRVQRFNKINKKLFVLSLICFAVLCFISSFGDHLGGGERELAALR